MDEEKKKTKYDLVTELPKLLITCPPGFGLNTKLPQLCGDYLIVRSVIFIKSY